MNQDLLYDTSVLCPGLGLLYGDMCWKELRNKKIKLKLSFIFFTVTALETLIVFVEI